MAGYADDNELQGDTHVDLEDDDHDFGDGDTFGGDANDEPPLDDEARARTMGWKPLAEYRGDPRRWKDYPEFLRTAEEEMPVLRDQLRRTTERLARVEPEMARLRATVDEQAQAVRDAMDLARRSDERGYQRALRELKDQQRQAVADGDTATFDAVQEQIEAMEAERSRGPTPATTSSTPPATPPAAPTMDPAVGAFVTANAGWFTDASRPYLRQAVIGLHNAIIAEGRIPGVAEQLVEAKRRLAVMYPGEPDLGEGQMADTPRPRPRAPPVLPPRSSNPAPRQPRAADPFLQIEDADDRREARAAFARLQRSDPKATAEEYVALYVNPHGDVLSLRAQRK